MKKYVLTTSTTLIIGWFLIFVAGTVIAFWGISHESLWYDESYSAAMAEHSIAAIIRFTTNDVHPPLYYCMLRVFRLMFGKSPAALRSLSVCGILAIALLGVGPVRRLFGDAGGLIFTGLVFLIPVNISMAQETRMYTWACFFVTGGVLYGYLAVAEHRKRDWLLFGMLTVFALYTHIYALLEMVIYYLLVGLWILFAHRKRLIPYVLTSIGVSLCYLPWVGSILNQVSNVSKEFWIPDPNSSLLVSTLMYPFGNKWGDAYYGWLAYLGLAVALYLAYRSLKQAIMRRDKEGRTIFFAMLLPILTSELSLVISISLKNPIYIPRYFFTLLGLFALIMMYGIRSFSARRIQLLVCVGLALLFTPEQWSLKRYHWNGPMFEVVETLRARVQPDDVFLHADEHTFGAFRYYFPNHQHYLYLPEGFAGYASYEPFLPNSVYGHDYKQFIRGKHVVWLTAKPEEWYTDKGFQDIPEQEMVKDGTFYQTSITYDFKVRPSWWRFDVTRFSDNPAEAFDPFQLPLNTLKVKVSGLRNRTGKVWLSVYPGALFEFAMEYVWWSDKIPGSIDAEIFDRYMIPSSGLSEEERTRLRELYSKQDQYTKKFRSKRAPEVREKYVLAKSLKWEEEESLRDIFFHVLHTQHLPISGDRVEGTVTDLPYGYYYVVVFHDENENWTLDFSDWTWRPVEGRGESEMIGPPFDRYFDQNSIFVEKDREIDLHITYPGLSN